MSERLEILLVTCSLEQTRADVLRQVVENINSTLPNLKKRIVAFDNASTQPGTVELLKENFETVFQAERNVGYWSAIDWWLHTMLLDRPKYVYVIESDMIHYGMPELAIEQCVDFLDMNTDVGGIRLHEYSVKDWRYYNKDAPISGSRKNVWQSHTNKVTGQGIVTAKTEHPLIWRSNFLTQLPAINRYESLLNAFAGLHALKRFTEPQFQKLYHDEHKCIGIFDGGIYHHDPGCVLSNAVTASWTDPKLLQKIGYQDTRMATITPRDQYKVTKR